MFYFLKNALPGLPVSLPLSQPDSFPQQQEVTRVVETVHKTLITTLNNGLQIQRHVRYRLKIYVQTSVADQYPYVCFWASGSISQRYGFGSGSIKQK
jgi:hypothetical protein